MVFKEITNETEIPVGSDLVVVELEDVLNGTFESASVLYGFDEVGMFTETTMGFVNPVYGFIDIEGGESFSVPDTIYEKEKSDFNDAMNDDYTGFDSFLENNLIA